MVKSVFKANFQSLDSIRGFVGQSAQEAALSDRDIYAVQLAADEASTNIIQHAYGGEGEAEIEIECEVLPGKLTIIFRDQGKSFDPSSVPEPNVKASLSERKVGGLGMYLIRNLMDEVRYIPAVDGGNTLTLVKQSETKS
jgi:anti-sigma regulatory factor (Ser/Thr protein kinase)